MSPFLLCELKPVTLTPTELRWDLVNVGVGVLLLVIGLTVSALFFFRPKWKDRSLIYFGVFTILYAVRLLGDRMLIDSVIDVSRDFWRYFSFFISSFIVLPFGLYLYEIVEPEVIASDPNRTVIPGFLVNAVVGCPYGAHPSPVQGYYKRDDPFFRQYHDQTKTKADSDAWLDRWVYSTADRRAYMNQLGACRMEELGVKQHAYAAQADFGY